MGSLRRIIGYGDFGEDVRIVQEALNFQLARPVEYGAHEPGYRELSEREYPDLWGYYWGEGARARYAKKHQDPNRYRHPVWMPARDPHLATDGKFGPLTEKAVIRYQQRCGIPDDGIVGPETWDYLIPLYEVKVLVVKAADNRTVTPGIPGVPQTPPSAPKRSTEFDNVAEQLGVQIDKNGVSGVFVLQATWKTSRLPDEFLPGHWEHTGGAQVVRPLGSDGGANLQAFYQITRAEVLEIELNEHIKITADLWVQPFVQQPLDRGSTTKPNLQQAGVNAGGTVQLEIKQDESSPTIKVFVQGGHGVTVDEHGGVDHGSQLFTGVSVEFDADQLLGGKKTPRVGPRQADGLQADPSFVLLKPGGEASVRINVKNAPQQMAPLYFEGLPPDVPTPMTNLSPFATSTVVRLRAAPGARASDSMVSIKYMSSNTMAPIVTYLRVVVEP